MSLQAEPLKSQSTHAIYIACWHTTPRCKFKGMCHECLPNCSCLQEPPER